MVRCICCNKRCHLHLRCKWCAHEFCANCLQMEIHQCTHMSEMKKNKKQSLESRLLHEKVNEIKVAKI